MPYTSFQVTPSGAGFGLVVEVQLDLASLKLAYHTLDTPLDGRRICAIASDEFLDNGSEGR